LEVIDQLRCPSKLNIEQDVVQKMLTRDPIFVLTLASS
jgi:hypothetical protein